MARYVDAHRAENLLRMCGTYHGVISFDTVIDVLHDTQTADVVEVVRCKDCKYLVGSEGVCKVLSNNYEPPVYVKDDDFCSQGERRDDD